MKLKMYTIYLILLSLLQIHAASVTVSGISSGGAMAVQFHVAFSSMVSGAGIVAGLPYYCAKGGVAGAYMCMDVPSSISLSSLTSYTSDAYSQGNIDDPKNMANSSIYLYSGTKDTVVNPGAMQLLKQYYETYLSSSKIEALFNFSSEHAFITKNFGSSCSFLGSPYINNCNYDQAGAILAHMYGTLQPAVSANSSNLITLGQAKFVPNGGLDAAYLNTDAYLYVPTKCSSGTPCDVHIAFHGCLQTLADINTDFVANTGYNGWAEANNIVIIYPQAKKGLMNPNGCWDWWGYTGSDYALQSGVQMTTVKNMAQYVMGQY